VKVSSQTRAVHRPGSGLCSRAESSLTEHFVPNEMQANTFGARIRIGEVTGDGVFHHGPQLFETVALRENRVPECPRDIAAIGVVLGERETSPNSEGPAGRKKTPRAEAQADALGTTGPTTDNAS
jgi:hypothetical protein